MTDPKAADPREEDAGDETVSPTATPGGVYDNPDNAAAEADEDGDTE